MTDQKNYCKYCGTENNKGKFCSDDCKKNYRKKYQSDWQKDKDKKTDYAYKKKWRKANREKENDRLRAWRRKQKLV